VSDTLAAVLREDPPWSQLPRDTPAPVARLLHRCLRKDVRQRLHDLADARIVLDDLADGAGSYESSTVFADLPVDGTATAVSRPASRRGRFLPLLALAGWLVAVAAGYLVLRPEAPPPLPPSQRNFTYSGRDWAPDASPDGDLVAFVSDRDGTSRIWLKPVAGGGEAPLTSGPDDMPRFSPDGSQLLFVRDTAGTRDLFRVSVLGGEPRKILTDVVEGDWSPDGERVAFLRLARQDADNIALIGTASLQSGDERILHRIVNRLCYGLRWTPDGDLVYAEASLTGNTFTLAGFHRVDATTGETTRLRLTSLRTPFTAPDWCDEVMVIGQNSDLLSHVSGLPARIMGLRDGRAEVLFWAPVRVPRGGWGFSTMAVLDDSSLVFDESVSRAGLLAVSLDRAAAGTVALPASLGRDRQPAFSPDGERIVFSSNRSGNVDLWLMDRDGGNLRQFTDDTANDWDPAFSPDGQWILWSSDRTGHMEVWMARSDGTGARRVTDDGEDAENPTMTPDGQWIVYASGNVDKLGIWRIRPDGSDATRLLAGAYLLPDVSPDGRHAVCSTIQDLNYLLAVLDVETGDLVPFEIRMDIRKRHEDLVYGRARWSPDGRSILYIGQDEQGRSGVYAQDFTPGTDTAGTRRPVAGFASDYTTESLGASPDGRTLVISAVRDRRVLKLVTGLDLGFRR
jgi:Tol biopolymer transport system component